MTERTIKEAEIIDLADTLKKAKREAKRLERVEKASRGNSGADAIIKADLEIFGRWIDEVGVAYSPRNHTFTYMGRDRVPGTMGRIAARAMVGSDFAQGSPELIATLYADIVREQYIDELREAIPLAGKASDNDALVKFLAFLLQSPPTVLDIAVFRQFIWQIKRRIHGAQTEWEMMPLFTGGQGWGKTRHLLKLWKSVPVLMNFVAKGQRFKVFEDDFGRAIFNQAFLIPFEEMSGARGADIETLKMFITEDEVQARIMRSEQFQVMRLNATFYGTTNLPGGASLSDSTGMRRFWTFECPNITYNDDVHGPMVAALDLGAVWGCVNATGEASPIRPHITALNQEQVRQFSRSGALHDFFVERIVADENPAAEISRNQVWDEFLRWKQGQSGYDREKLTRQHVGDYVRKVYGQDRVKLKNTGEAYLGLKITSYTV
jgi:hypothetical protein